ncbi:MAG: hypothetical protein R6U98_11740 [Pirellulaceae bacterium]
MIQKIYELDSLSYPKCNGAMRSLPFIEVQEVTPGDLSYLERYKMLPTLAAEVKESVAQLEAVKQAARECADRNLIPLEVFSEPVDILNLGEEAGSLTADEEILITMRELFDGVLLSW